MKLRITISKYHSWHLCQISLQIMLLPILIFSSPQDRETCTWARIWISSGVSRKWNISCGVTKLPIEWPNLFTTKRKRAFQACLLAASESSHAVNLMKYKSLQKRTLKLLLCFQLLRQNTSYKITYRERINQSINQSINNLFTHVNA